MKKTNYRHTDKIHIVMGTYCIPHFGHDSWHVQVFEAESPARQLAHKLSKLSTSLREKAKETPEFDEEFMNVDKTVLVEAGDTAAEHSAGWPRYHVESLPIVKNPPGTDPDKDSSRTFKVTLFELFDAIHIIKITKDYEMWYSEAWRWCGGWSKQEVADFISYDEGYQGAEGLKKEEVRQKSIEETKKCLLREVESWKGTEQRGDRDCARHWSPPTDFLDFKLLIEALPTPETRIEAAQVALELVKEQEGGDKVLDSIGKELPKYYSLFPILDLNESQSVGDQIGKLSPPLIKGICTALISEAQRWCEKNTSLTPFEFGKQLVARIQRSYWRCFRRLLNKGSTGPYDNNMESKMVTNTKGIQVSLTEAELERLKKYHAKFRENSTSCFLLDEALDFFDLGTRLTEDINLIGNPGAVSLARVSAQVYGMTMGRMMWEKEAKKEAAREPSTLPPTEICDLLVEVTEFLNLKGYCHSYKQSIQDRISVMVARLRGKEK